MQKSALIAAVAAMGMGSMAFAVSGVRSTGTEISVGAGQPVGQVSPRDAVLYDNVPVGAETVSTTTSTPRTTGGDEFIILGSPTQHAAKVTSMQFGYSVAAGGPAAFDARVRFYDDIDFLATTAASSQFLNPVADFTLNFTGQTAGAFITAPIDLSTLPGGGVSFTDNVVNNGVGSDGLIDGFFVVSFLNAGTQTNVTNNLVTFLFDFTGVNAGASYDSASVGGTQADAVYWRDANGNQTINGDEARSFAAPSRANLVLHLEGTIVPEPASLAALSLGGLMIRRRRA